MITAAPGRMSRRSRSAFLADGPSISSRVALEDEYRSLCRILDLLPAESQQLFVMKFVQELTNQEIAAELGTSISTLKRDVAELIRTIQKIRAARR